MAGWSSSAHALNSEVRLETEAICNERSEVITAILEFAKLNAVARLSATGGSLQEVASFQAGRAGKEAVQCLFSPLRLAAIRSFNTAIWAAQLPVLERLAEVPLD